MSLTMFLHHMGPYYDSGYAGSSISNLFLAVLIGGVAALIAILIMRRNMNTARHQHHAVAYVKQNSYRLTAHRDTFLYSQVSKTPKPKNNNGPGGPGRGPHGGPGR